MKDDHLYIVTYDIKDDNRWKKVYKTMKGYGEWIQLSVFQCKLNGVKALRMDDTLRGLIDEQEDHVLIFDLGPADSIKPKVKSLGKPFVPVSCEATIV